MIDKLIRNLPVITILLLAGVLFVLFSFTHNLDKAIERLEQAEAGLDSSLKRTALARQAIDSVHSDLARFSIHIREIQGRVEMLDFTERSGSEKFKNQKDLIVRKLRDLFKEVEASSKDLPEIPIVSR